MKMPSSSMLILLTEKFLVDGERDSEQNPKRKRIQPFKKLQIAEQPYNLKSENGSGNATVYISGALLLFLTPLLFRIFYIKNGNVTLFTISFKRLAKKPSSFFRGFYRVIGRKNFHFKPLSSASAGHRIKHFDFNAMPAVPFGEI